MCGEEPLSRLAPGFPPGSPPHVRGRAVAGVARAAGVGITPACAGKSAVFYLSATEYGDHPRMCGEEQRYWRDGCFNWGSPPHVRGRVPQPVQFIVLGRITPACAGKSGGHSFPDHSQKDHPRMCGEEYGGRLFQHRV